MLYTGVTAKVTVNTNQVAHISNFSISISSEIIEAVSFGDGWKEKVPSIKDWTASTDGSLDVDTDSNQQVIINGIFAGAILPFEFYIDETVKMSGNAYVESVDIDTAADDKANISISLSGSGALVTSFAN